MEIKDFNGEESLERAKSMQFAKSNFAKLIISDLSNSSQGRRFLKKYKQSEVREIIENYKIEKNQEKLRDIAQLLWVKSPQFQRLIKYFAEMSTFAHVITPIKDLKSLNKNKVLNQYTMVGELLKMMNIKHEIAKVLTIAFREDIFFGYIHKDKKSFYIQQMPFEICKVSSVEDGILNYSIDMSYFEKNENSLKGWAIEIQYKYREWKLLKDSNPKISKWVELDAQNTICIKMNEEMVEVFPPFAGVFDSIFDIEAFKDLRKDREKLGNYMILAQKLPVRQDTETNNDFMIDGDFTTYFHNQVSDTVPENVGVVTSPMEIDVIKFDKETVDTDGVAKATRDFWEAGGASQLLFGSNNTSSSGLAMSVISDEAVVFNLLSQVERWLNRYLRFEFKELYFNVKMLPVTWYNREKMHQMYLMSAQYGVPVKSHLSAVVDLEPIEVMNMSYLENDLLKMHEEWIPLVSSHTQTNEDMANQSGGAPKKSNKDISDEGDKSRDKDG